MGMDKSKKVGSRKKSAGGTVAGNALAPGRRARGTNVKSTKSNRKDLRKR